ncbi:olfactory receptor 11H6-like [Rhineura floridana]|uniref:olfactory receptor 11H6-like n=1 Tax=Rhineura floridana TaxID=261503 RepID=UPI002AC86E55|nr:olfactory receptor 11H6-like [Rhineura floridana]XP_061447478.1 olfactory receptor 11H6-like [Rhineura floridana]
MEMDNATTVQEFILLGFEAEQQQKRFLLLILFAILYILTLGENITIITVVSLDNHLAQLPMYILLSNFSWLEICYVTTTVPRMLFDLASPREIISFQACFLQFYISFSLGCTECFFLSAMALDRYLAICHPLRYPQLMTQQSCYSLVGTCWVVGFLCYPIPLILISKLSFCGPNIIDHFLCDVGPILSVACPPFGNIPLVCQIFMNTLVLINVSFVVLSYSIVILSLMKTSSPGRRRKAFSTISFHIMVVTLFYGTAVAMYLIPGGESQSTVTKVVTTFYAAVIPFLNPMIYCLRNDQVKEALDRLLKRKERLLRRTVAV